MSIISQTNEFLKDIEMHPDLTDISEIQDYFMVDMARGLEGEPSSLQMIPSYIKTTGIPSEGKPVIAIDAGGTNLRTALVTFEFGEPKVAHLEKCKLPGSISPITANQLFDTIAEIILPLTEFSDHIGFCFSFVAEIFPNYDGKIISFNKEVNVKGGQGKIIGENLINALNKKGVKKPMHFTLLNDTTAVLMGALATMAITDHDGCAGLILGTGFNCCYEEQGRKITKLENANNMIINCEAGIFDKAVRGKSDKMTDESSDKPNDHLLEKMISGGYHGNVISNTAILANQARLLSNSFSENSFTAFTSQEIDNFIKAPNGDNRIAKMCSGNDKEVLTEIIDKSYDRAAKLVCAVIAALVNHTDGGKCDHFPFAVAAEGSAFYNSLLFKDKLEKQVENYIGNMMAKHVVICNAEKSTLVGSALASLIN